MSQLSDVYAAGPLDQDSSSASDRPSGSTTDVAKEQAGQVKDTATDAAQHVAGVAKDQVGQVAAEAKSQAQDLLSQGRQELVDQTSAQQQRVASGLRSLETELHSMAASSADHGIGADLARQAATRAGTVAHWMEGREPGDLLEEVRSFARQRPAAFLGIAAAAGVVAGRLGRGLKDGSAGSGSTTPTTTTPVGADTAVTVR